MNYRERMFNNKFKNACKFLKAERTEIVSLKIRGIARSSEYDELVDLLKGYPGIYVRNIRGDFQGQGHLVTYNHQKVIFVEHETGLEILYIAGAIASLACLVHIIIRSWNNVHISWRRHGRARDNIEIRFLNNKGKLREESHPTSATKVLTEAKIDFYPFLLAIEDIKSRLEQFKIDIGKIESRVSMLEKGNRKSVRKAAAKRVTTKRKKKVKKARSKN